MNTVNPSAGPGPAAVHGARDALDRLAHRARAGTVRPLAGVHAFDPAVAAGYRAAAVMILFAPTPAAGKPAPEPGVDVFLVQRSPHLRDHPGQIALPGGRIEETDAGEAAGALRETHEEIGLDPSRIEVLAKLPPVLVPVSRFVVTPVLGWTDDADKATDVEPGEVLHTIRVPVGALLDPATRAAVTIVGRRSAGFRVPTGWVWGFTGNLLDHVFTELGWTRPWDTTREVPMRLDRGLVIPA
ncbi:CoA pyrophosphatase [Georgenia sp. SYP-B2076]|uniref:NUDIX hydrolase n=1 Tax=Georgenia sp. SYP-B2076 TaxID=2495881 RepID=UPI000F8CA727|nr:CoA pyrophosphatase [Georgenia sp. SYP-B2076]